MLSPGPVSTRKQPVQTFLWGSCPAVFTLTKSADVWGGVGAALGPCSLQALHCCVWAFSLLMASGG